MNRGFYLGQIFGIPIRADLSVLILVAYIMWVFRADPVLGVLIALGLLLSIVWHELAHSLTAMAFGGKVRVITLQLMGGCASISEMPQKAWQEWIMAAAGPLSSFVLAGILWAALWPTTLMLLSDALASLAFINIMLGLFNLMPAFPMDGGRILRATLQSSMSKIRATWIASRIGRAIAVVFIVVGVLNWLDVHIPMTRSEWFFIRYLQVFLLQGSGLKIFIGLSIFQAAEMEYRMLLAQEARERQNPWRGFGNPFAPPPPPPPDDDSAFISPPPYRKDKPDRIDIKRGE
ncbi:MAG: site-2 protease family protein [Kiritimatiellaeota bacterium]|nr:site-2 protease family protein [Kiritimatiellota bacterium]